jgi:Fe2+ or Zn2+ uptake regulation protein
MNNSEHIELRVEQIISTEKRKVVMGVIVKYGKSFSISDLHSALLAKRINIRLTAVLNLVKSLHHAGLLSESHEVRSKKKEGRPKNVYTMVPDFEYLD